MMLLAAPQPPPNHPFEYRRQYPRAQHDRSSVAGVTTTPDLILSPALSDFPAPGDGTLATQFSDALALGWDGAYSPAESASSLMHGYYTSTPPPHASALYRAPPRSSSQQQQQQQHQQHQQQQPPASNLGYEAGGVSLDPHNWQSFGHQQQARPISRFGGQLAGHKRNHSGSTVTSTAPSSPFTPVQSFPYIHDPELRYPSPLLESFDLNNNQQSLAYAKPIAPNTPTFSDTYVQPQYQHPAYHADPNLVHQAAMRRAMKQADGEPPALPRLPTGEFDSSFRATLDSRGQGAPRLDRSLSDIYKDELYNPNFTPPATAPLATSQRTPARGPSGSQSASPNGRGGEFFSQLLQAANDRRLSAQSESAGNVSRERSPFQANSTFAHELGSNPMQSAAQMRERQKAASDAYAYAQHHPRHSTPEEPKTISPKDAFRDTSEVDASDFGAGAMFPPMSAVSAAPMCAPMPTTTSSSSSQNESRRPLAAGAMASLRRQGSSQHSTETQRTSVSTSTPDFRVPLSSMESTRSDSHTDAAQPYASSQDSAAASSHSGDHTPLRRPQHTTADSGTYSCTYHHCAQRFETAAKLQKHKRDVHRPVSPIAHGPGFGPGPIEYGEEERGAEEEEEEDDQQVHSPRTTAALLAARNSQAGPHRCARINPSTGRPCNSIFSRPYDLTRHEDTIHNSRKHKVRCPYCAEEKTFSRADALTRHLRVVHPEKDAPGRRRRAH